MTLTLRQLTENDEEAFFEGMKEWEGESPAWYTFAWTEGMSYKEMLKILKDEAEGKNLKPNRVAHTMLYAFVDDKIIGRVSIRHELNEYLKHRGGHIGYAVAKRWRRKGYATEMLNKAIPYCKSIGLKELMITCADENEPSWKIIESAGGKLQDKIWDEEDKETIRRYWLKI